MKSFFILNKSKFIVDSQINVSTLQYPEIKSGDEPEMHLTVTE